MRYGGSDLLDGSSIVHLSNCFSYLRNKKIELIYDKGERALCALTFIILLYAIDFQYVTKKLQKHAKKSLKTLSPY